MFGLTLFRIRFQKLLQHTSLISVWSSLSKNSMELLRTYFWTFLWLIFFLLYFVVIVVKNVVILGTSYWCYWNYVFGTSLLIYAGAVFCLLQPPTVDNILLITNWIYFSKTVLLLTSCVIVLMFNWRSNLRLEVYRIFFRKIVFELN